MNGMGRMMPKYKKIVIDKVGNGYIVSVDDVPSVFNAFREVLRLIINLNLERDEIRMILETEIERLGDGNA